MSDIINDGQVQHGSRQLTIDGAVYETDDFSWDTATSTTVERTNRLGVLTGRVSIKGGTTGSCTLQLADDAAVLPEWGDQFTTTEGTCSITSVGKREGKGAEMKVPVSFVLNVTADVVVS